MRPRPFVRVRLGSEKGHNHQRVQSSGSPKAGDRFGTTPLSPPERVQADSQLTTALDCGALLYHASLGLGFRLNPKVDCLVGVSFISFLKRVSRLIPALSGIHER